jgi:hypothetical protein
VCYYGGPVQFFPAVYLLLWGPAWQTDPKQEAAARFLDGFYSALGYQYAPSPDLLSTVTAQYYDNQGDAPTFENGNYVGEFHDATTPHKGVSLQAIANKVDSFAAQHGLLVPGYPTWDVQVVVATQSGTCPHGFSGDIFPCPLSNGPCGSHWNTPDGVPFIVLPYQNDDSSGCGERSVPSSVRESNYDGFTMSAIHEFAETATDPLPRDKPAWYAETASGPSEIADKCDPSDDPRYAFDEILDNGKSYAVQELWSNADYLATGDGCVAGWGRMATLFNPNGLWIAATNGVQITSGSPVQVWGPNKGTIPPAAQFTHVRGQLMLLGWCISDPGLGGAGTKLVYQRCGLHPSQRWAYNSTHHWYVLSANGLCLTDPGDSFTGGTHLRLRTCADSRSMQWTKI